MMNMVGWMDASAISGLDWDEEVKSRIPHDTPTKNVYNIAYGILTIPSQADSATLLWSSPLT